MARAAPDEISRLREFFGHRVLRSFVDDYILAKFDEHVIDDEQWPSDTTPEEYLDSLRETVLDPRSGIYLTSDNWLGEWTIYFSGRVRRACRGVCGSNRVLVAFNAERHRFVTGFQPDDDDVYVVRRSGFWIRTA